MYPVTHVVPVRLPNGAIIQVEATPIAQARPKAAEQDISEREYDITDRAPLVGPQDFGEVMAAVEGVAASVTGSLSKVRAREATVEFGLELGVEAGKLTALLAKGSAKATLKITFHWSDETTQKSDVTLSPSSSSPPPS